MNYKPRHFNDIDRFLLGCFVQAGDVPSKQERKDKSPVVQGTTMINKKIRRPTPKVKKSCNGN